MPDGRLHDEDVALGKAFDPRLARRLITFVRPYWFSVVLGAVLIMGTSALDLVGPKVTQYAIDHCIVPHQWQGLGRIVGLWFAVILAALALKSLQGWTTQMMGQHIMRDLRRTLFDHVMHLPMATFDRTATGRLLARITSDVDALNELFTSGIVAVIADVFVLIGITSILITMNWKLAVLTTMVVPILVALTTWFKEKARDTYRRVRSATSRISGYLSEHLGGMSTVQLYGQEDAAQDSFDALNRELWRANMDSVHYYSLFYPGVELIGALGIAAIIAYGGTEVLGGVLTVGALVAFIQYSTRFFQPISDLADKYNILQAAMAAAERIFNLLDEPQAPDASAAEAPVGGGPASIEFRHVTFEYVPDQEVLKNVSLTIRPGEKVAFVGHTGAGKTSLVNMLLRYYELKSGQVLLDGVDIRDVPGHRRHFGVVLQEPFIFSGTLQHNIRLGDDVSDEEVRAAAARVGLEGFIDSLPQGFDEVMQERGVTLSAGQRQLLSFARALARRPRVLVLDEATSSIDAGSEALIQQALSRLSTTCVIIAHRLATVQNCDRIYVLSRGEVREAGTHQELLAARGLYHRLYTLQSRRQQDGVAA